MAKDDLPIHTGQYPRVGTHHGVRVREDVAFTSHKGEQKEKLVKRTQSALERLQEPLRKLLKADEAVLCVCECQASVGALEQLTMGWYIYQVSRVVLVLTNQRLLHFLAKPKAIASWQWQRSLRAVAWGDVESAEVKGLLGLELLLKFRDGKKEKYWRVSRADGKKIKAILEVVLPRGGGEATAALGMVQLCPQCVAVLTPGIYQCSQCPTEFKDEQTMVRRSLLIPGGGYFYCGQYFLALPDAFVEGLLLLMVLLYLLIGFGVMADTPDENGTVLEGSSALVAAGIFALILAVEKAVTIHHCRRFIRNYMPKA